MLRVCSAAVYACFIGEVTAGVGEHITNPQLLGDTETIQEWSYFHAWIVVAGISFVKISIGFFLLRLVQGKWLKVNNSARTYSYLTNSVSDL